MLSVYASLTPVFILIAIGFGLRKSGLIAAEQWRGIEMLCFWVLFPALMITVLADSTLSFGEAAPFVLALFAVSIVMPVLMWLLRRPLEKLVGMNGPTYTSFFQATTRWHGFIALAVVGNLFGAPGLAVLALAFAALAPLTNIFSILVLATYASGRPATPALVVTTILRNPVILSVIVGLGIKLSGLALPDIVHTTLGLAGDGALGVSLLALGAGLSWKAVKSSGPAVLIASCCRLVLTPLVAWALASAFGVGGMPFVIAIIAAAVPTAVNGYVLARAMGGDAEYYAATVTAQVILSFLTLPFFIWAAMAWTGG